MIRIIVNVISLLVAYCSKSIALAPPESPQESDPSKYVNKTFSPRVARYCSPHDLTTALFFSKLPSFGPITSGDYTIEGIYNPYVHFDGDTAVQLRRVLRSLKEHMLPNERTKRGAGWIGYEGQKSEIEIRFTWNKAMTYAECDKAIESLYTYLIHNANQNRHPIRVDLSETAVSGMIITVDISFTKGKSQSINVDTDLEFRGLFYPDRTMPAEAVQRILKIRRDEAESQGAAIVPIPWYKPYKYQNLSSSVSVVLVWPQLTVPFTKIANLMKAVETFYSAPGAKQGMLVGEIRWKNPLVFVGEFKVLIQSHEISPFRTLEGYKDGNIS